jgi:hypothetical protein
LNGNDHLEYFIAIWYNLWPFGICSLWSFDRFFPFWYVWTKKSQATLFVMQFSEILKENVTICIVKMYCRVARFLYIIYYYNRYTKMGKCIPNGHKIYHLAIKHNQWTQKIPNMVLPQFTFNASHSQMQL